MRFESMANRELFLPGVFLEGNKTNFNYNINQRNHSIKSLFLRREKLKSYFMNQVLSKVVSQATIWWEGKKGSKRNEIKSVSFYFQPCLATTTILSQIKSV